jgi:hypothetical protein
MDNINRESTVVPIQVKEHAGVLGEVEKPAEGILKHKPASHVRFTIIEWTQLQNDQAVTGKSIPELLKSRYFKNGPLATLMSPAAQDYMLNELRRIGNNVNQIAKVLNSGFREGWNSALAQVRDDLDTLRRYVVGFYGNH